MKSIVTYTYFPTPSDNGERLCSHICSIGLDISHFGFRDPPKKCLTCCPGDLVASLAAQKELNRILFIRDKRLKLDMTVEVNRDKRWPYSGISISGLTLESALQKTNYIANILDAFIAIQGDMDGGKNQAWNVIHRSSECPVELLQCIGLTSH